MVKTILKQLREFKLPSILTPLCMIGEVICEMIIPILMAKIVDSTTQTAAISALFSKSVG